MNLRIGALVISVNLVFLAAAFAFFVRLSFQRLYPVVAPNRARALATLVLVCCAGILGAWLYGIVGVVKSPASSSVLPSAFEIPFGSFGGYWGVVLGSFAASALLRTPYLRQVDTFVPGILAGGAIARLPGLFTAANPGVVVNVSNLPWFQPFRIWAIYDIVIHLLALFIVWRLVRRYGPIPGLALAVFLVGYGAMRWLIEFVRDTSHVCGPFSYGQLMALAQFLPGAGLVIWLWRRVRISN